MPSKLKLWWEVLYVDRLADLDFLFGQIIVRIPVHTTKLWVVWFIIHNRRELCGLDFTELDVGTRTFRELQSVQYIDEFVARRPLNKAIRKHFFVRALQKETVCPWCKPVRPAQQRYRKRGGPSVSYSYEQSTLQFKYLEEPLLYHVDFHIVLFVLVKSNLDFIDAL